MVYETDVGCIYDFGNRVAIRACTDTDIRLATFVLLDDAWLVHHPYALFALTTMPAIVFNASKV